MLYLVATPIGNLGDITYRAIQILGSCDYILCEDTRHSLPLLNHYHIHKPLKSYHKFNEAESLPQILSDLQSGKQIALISDAGTPGISDPGTKLVQHCLKHQISVSPLPGPCAAIAALTCSGFNTDVFQFIGFLPRAAQELHSALQTILQYPGTTICYETPHRLLKTLEVLHKLAPERPLAVARELTKKFEEKYAGCAQEQITHWTSHPLKGEIVLMIAGQERLSHEAWADLSEIEHVEYLEQTFGLSRREAIKMAAEQRGVPKRSVYAKVIKQPEL
jgi:16S rRNA (cytidine1402-2'-O)-methyltransferase